MNNGQEKMPLTSDKRRELRGVAHHLKPVIRLGKRGVSEALVSEIKNALLAHELIKIQMAQAKEIDEDLQAIIEKTSSEHINTIGNIIVLFKRRENLME